VGFGVLLTLPTLVAAASLPPDRLATGSGVISMARQLGFTLGVALFVAATGTHTRGPAELQTFRHGWLAIAVLATAAAATSLALAQPRRRLAPQSKPALDTGA
jgi:hypothetical protein